MYPETVWRVLSFFGNRTVGLNDSAWWTFPFVWDAIPHPNEAGDLLRVGRNGHIDTRSNMASMHTMGRG